ncbi:hypothetical protein EVA_06610 [gut metagenome]|uniref:Uncharacterized protein n=1 Tax=gut metagenome TaxID=749906 RepID=J9GX59_9ZZZZ
MCVKFSSAGINHLVYRTDVIFTAQVQHVIFSAAPKISNFLIAEAVSFEQAQSIQIHGMGGGLTLQIYDVAQLV